MDTTAFFKLSYGMYVVSSAVDGRLNGQIANTVFQITAEPATLAVSINKQNLTHEYIKESMRFTVSVLSKDAPMEFIGRFGFKSGRDIDKFEAINFDLSEGGIPYIIDYSLAWFLVKVDNMVDCGTHTLFIGRVVDTQSLSDGEPMTYAYYHQVKKGLSPKTAPTYIKKDKDKTNQEADMKKYRCSVCGYVYDPSIGDPDNGIEPGTPFESLPDDWVCPVCGVGKEQFEEA